MFTTCDEFLAIWQSERDATQQLFDALTDASLAQSIAADHRTIGRLAWHIAQTIPEMMGHTGLTLDGPGEHDPVPTSAQTIADGYRTAAASLDAQLSAQWTDETLAEVDDMYGERWSRGRTLDVLLLHQVHHRGQLTVLMRQAGLPVIGVYGPSRDDWGSMGMDPPAI
jgi:uncharacterized damage-inducible protein DinB